MVEKGTTNGTITDVDGNYKLNVNDGAATLLFSHIGYLNQEMAVGSRKVIDLQLQPDAQQLSEVVVTAFGVNRQAKTLGYADANFSGEELTEVPTANPLETLSGRIAGVDISSPAQPGASPKVIFRGMGSITGSNRPLYIVDGSPISDIGRGSIGTTNSFDAGTGINDLDPNNIESINFLKGAAAATLYGSRGANGVIIITTKKGKKKLKATFSSSIDFLEVARTVHKQQLFGTGWDGKSYSNVSGEGSRAASNENGSWGAAFNGRVRPWSRIVNNQQLIKPYVPLKDNVRDFYDLGRSLNNSISISGGSKNSDFSFTYSRVDMDGVIPTDRDSYRKNNFGINAGIESGKFKIRVSGNYSDKEQKAVPTGQSSDASFGKTLTQEMTQIPNDLSIVDMKDMSVIFNRPSYFYTPYTTNPYSSLQNNNVNISKSRFFGNINASYQFNDQFSAVFQIGTDTEDEDVKRWGAIVKYLPGSPHALASANPVVGAVSEAKYTAKQLDTYLNLNYNTSFQENFTLSILLGATLNQRSGEALSTQVNGLNLPNYYELSNSASTPIISQSSYLRRLLGVYSEAVLGYLDRYFLTLTARNDFSSTLPQKNNSYFYPSVSLAAVVLDNDKYFTKLRGSFARAANDANLYQIFSTAGQAANDAYFGSITYPFEV